MSTNEQIATYVRHLQALLHLHQWDITLSTKTARKGYYATMTYNTSGSLVATLTLGRGFAKRSPEEQRQTILHELLHLYDYGIDATMDDLKRYILDVSYAPISERFRFEVECRTDALARVLAPRFPLPHGDGVNDPEVPEG